MRARYRINLDQATGGERWSEWLWDPRDPVPPEPIRKIWDEQDRAKLKDHALRCVDSGKIQIVGGLPGEIASMKTDSYEARWVMDLLLAVGDIGIATGWNIYRENGKDVRRCFHIAGSRTVDIAGSIFHVGFWRKEWIEGLNVWLQEPAVASNHDIIISKIKMQARG